MGEFRFMLFSQKHILKVNSFSGEYYFACQCCDGSNYKCGTDGITAVKRHGSSESDKKNFRNSKTVFDVFQIARNAATSADRQKELERKITLYVVRNNLPITAVDDLVSLIKSINEVDKDVVKSITMSRTKCTSIINKLLVRAIFLTLFNTCSVINSL